MSDPEYYYNQLNGLALATRRTLAYEKYYYSELLYSLLINLSLQISRVSDQEKVQNNPTVSLIISYLEEHYSENISLADLSEALEKTPEYLCSVFRKSLQLTIIEELTNIRITHARNMLVEYPEKNASEIGYLCGFQSPSYFGKVFKKKCGVSPSEYRLKKL